MDYKEVGEKRSANASVKHSFSTLASKALAREQLND